MKIFKILAVVGAFGITGAAFADHHEDCMGKDGKEVATAKDKASCDKAGGKWEAKKEEAKKEAAPAPAPAKK